MSTEIEGHVMEHLEKAIPHVRSAVELLATELGTTHLMSLERPMDGSERDGLVILAHNVELAFLHLTDPTGT